MRIYKAHTTSQRKNMMHGKNVHRFLSVVKTKESDEGSS